MSVQTSVSVPSRTTDAPPASEDRASLLAAIRRADEHKESINVGERGSKKRSRRNSSVTMRHRGNGGSSGSVGVNSHVVARAVSKAVAEAAVPRHPRTCAKLSAYTLTCLCTH